MVSSEQLIRQNHPQQLRKWSMDGSLKHQKHVATDVNTGCSSLSYSMVCLSLLYIHHVNFYGENLLDGTKMTGDYRGTHISVTDRLISYSSFLFFLDLRHCHFTHWKQHLFLSRPFQDCPLLLEGHLDWDARGIQEPVVTSQSHLQAPELVTLGSGSKWKLLDTLTSILFVIKWGANLI